MPIYEYQCVDCGHQLDALQKISEPPLLNCPQCLTDSLKRLISAPQFRLKGSGWYETDFKKDKHRNLAGDSKPADSADNKAADKKPDSKDSAPKTTEKKADKGAASDA